MVITTVDSVNGWFQLDQNEECVKQVTVADRIVLTKSDIAETGQTDRRRKRLVLINTSADFITAVAGDLDIARLLTADLYDPEHKGEDVLRWLRDEEIRAGEAHDHQAVDTGRHDAHIHSFCIIQEEPIDWTAFGIWLTMLLHTHGDDLEAETLGQCDHRGSQSRLAVACLAGADHRGIDLEAAEGQVVRLGS